MNLEPGNYIVEFQIENNLKPGLYKLHVGAHHRHSKLKNVFCKEAVNLEILGFTEHGTVQPPNNPGFVNWVEFGFSYEKT